MDEKNNVDDNKVDDVMLPGFRFHPTDEELVGFYLRRKILQQPLPIELIKQVDIYKFDPWDLPKLASTGEKEWYFYCPRDRKYRNSTRPNRVTGAGFWKATGTDRPIYSSDNAKCIGLKKSLVFYRGRAAKGIKTDWMMHEFRLPSLSDHAPPKKFFDRSLPANDSWAICRIFKKTNSITQQRAFLHSWVSPFPDSTPSDAFTHSPTPTSATHFIPESSAFPIFPTDLPNNYFPTIDFSGIPRSMVDVSPLSMLLNLSPALPGSLVTKTTDTANSCGSQQQQLQFQFNGFSTNLTKDQLQGEEEQVGLKKSEDSTVSQWSSNIQSIELPFSFQSNSASLSWDSSACPSDMTTSFSSNKYYKS